VNQIGVQNAAMFYWRPIWANVDCCTSSYVTHIPETGERGVEAQKLRNVLMDRCLPPSRYQRSATPPEMEGTYSELLWEPASVSMHE